MKKCTIIMTLSMSLCAEVNLNISTSSYASSSSSPTTHIVHHQHTPPVQPVVIQPSAALTSPQPAVSVQATECIEHRTSYMKRIIGSLTSWNLSKLLYASAAIGVTAYGLLYGKLILDGMHLQSQDTWSSWKEHIPVEVLLEVPQNEVAEELFTTIKERASDQEPMQLIIGFHHDIDAEITFLNNYLKLYRFLVKSHLELILPSQEANAHVATLKIRRLLYLKDTLMTWLSANSDMLVHGKIIPRSQLKRSVAW